MTTTRHRQHWIAFSTIVIREVRRFLRIWAQTLLPPAITMTLYFIIFGSLIGSRIGAMDGFDYMAYIAPGVIMMSIINNAYANVASSFFSAKFQNHIEELIVAPVPNYLILAGYVVGGTARGLLIGVIVTIVALFFTDLSVQHWGVTLSMVVLSAILFALGGFINAVYARSFDEISIIPTFVLTPLTYLGGVFYSISLLPEVWQKLSLLNPVLYMVNAFRYGLLGTSDVPVVAAFVIILLFIASLTWYALHLLKKGTGLRS
ncbi:ABC-type multidrug transport system, permease component [Methylophaga frappieri]|uniref:Transport permease protein n=1 Tax=Methylophaga frappieri (strain ATCC BAA-2434 / DSM 25690 / JAM7) TaxID=754477 RepID=I1YIU3_METFJ|nr:ABC transporter permease [Methylophaga frappieri]AFJ02836.1 ABC-type multidrug transport system, permease component [Methylophaga frappieri]